MTVRMRQQVTIQRNTSPSTSGTGQVIGSYTDIQTIFASIEDISGEEVTVAQAKKGLRSYKITIRGGIPINPTDRLYEAATGITMNVLSAINVEHLGGYTEIMAKELIIQQ